MNQTLTTSEAAAVTAAESSALLDRTPFQVLCYEMFRVVSASTLTFGFSFRSRGQTNVPRHGPALLVANHQSYLDPVVAGVAAGRRLSYLARKTLFRHRFFTWAIRTLQAVPVDQEGTGIDGVRAVLKLLHAGKAVLVFPEGERSPDGSMVSLQPGVQLLSKRGRAPLIPVGIAGAYEAWPRWREYPIPAPVFLPQQRNTIAVVIGKPLSPASLAELPKTKALQVIFEEISKVRNEAERLRRGYCEK